MKTTIFFSALLALIIQVMVKNQTQEAQVSSSKDERTLPQTKQNNDLGPGPKKLTPVLHKTKSAQNKTTQTTTIASSTLLETYYLENNGKIRRSTSKFNFADLQNQAKDLLNKSIQLRNAANNSEGLVKTELLNEAKDLQKLYIMKQIEASEALGKVASTRFNENKQRIGTLLDQFHGSNVIYKNASTLSDEAEQSMKMAREMREEAYAMPTIQAEFGTMTNAEEKEGFALNLQDKAIQLLDPGTIPFHFKNDMVWAGTPWTPKIETYEDLVSDANDLHSKYIKLQTASTTRSGLTKTELIREAKYLYTLAEQKQIAASELSAKNTYAKFSQNKAEFNNLIASYKGDKNIVKLAMNLINDADKCIKMAKEMREEAYAMPTIEAEIGTMSNAQEKEALAMNKEYKAVDLIKNAPKMNFNTVSHLVASVGVEHQ
jgi:hypothetical protein